MPSKEYKRLLDEAWDIHVRKNAGYAGFDNADPWANFRMSEAFGVSAFDGCLVRLSDKYIRVTNLRKDARNEQVNESLRDTLVDLAAYALIAVCLLDEQNGTSIYDDDWGQDEPDYDGADMTTLEAFEAQGFLPGYDGCDHGRLWEIRCWECEDDAKKILDNVMPPALFDIQAALMTHKITLDEALWLVGVDADDAFVWRPTWEDPIGKDILTTAELWALENRMRTYG